MKDFKDLGFGSFVYAILFTTEAVGLWLAKRWGEWLTISITAALIPLEWLEIYRNPSAVKATVLLINLGVVAYLVFGVRKESADVRRSVRPHDTQAR